MGLLDQAAQGGAVVPELANAAAGAGAPAPQAAGPEAGAPPAGPAAGAPPAAGPAPAPGAQPVENPQGASLPLQQQDAAPEEQQEYERAMRALAQVLYSNDKTANSIVDQIDAQGDKVGSTAKVSMLLIKSLDQKVNLNENVVSAVTQETVERIMELSEARHGIQYQPDEAEKILGATWEGIQAMFGGDPQQFAAFSQGLDGSKMGALQQEHEARLNG